MSCLVDDWAESAQINLIVFLQKNNYSPAARHKEHCIAVMRAQARLRRFLCTVKIRCTVDALCERWNAYLLQFAIYCSAVDRLANELVFAQHVLQRLDDERENERGGGSGGVFVRDSSRIGTKRPFQSTISLCG